MTQRALSAAILCLSLMAPLSAAHAEGQRQTLGWGRLFTNDALGDLHDRWHSGSYNVSLLRGPGWSGDLPNAPGQILEYRFTAGTITPGNLTTPDPDDRPYVAPLSLGVHTHFYMAGFDTRLGADLVAIGPQTGVGRFQTWLHDLLNVGKPDLSSQLGNAIHPTLSAEVGRDLPMADVVTIHPFIAAQAGVETLVRAGGDVVIGNFGQGALLLRDETTGQRYRGIAGQEVPGMSFTLGGDIARVFDSAYLPEGGAVEANDIRTRLRAGLAWQGEDTQLFYGVTWLGPEFTSQPEGQLLGSVNLNLRF